MTDDCKFCDALERAKRLSEFSKRIVDYKYDSVFSVALVTRTKKNGRIQKGKITDYRCRGVGYALKYCPECGRCLFTSDTVIEKAKPPRKYIVRRLTPVECARLQGFHDCWGDIEQISAENMARLDNKVFWERVRETQAKIAGRAYKPMKSPEALAKWHNGLHTDSAEYKMWGNGIALPCARFVLGRIKVAFE